MHDIIYHDGFSDPGKDEHNVRIDVVGDRYVLRACKIVVGGADFRIASDTWWPHFSNQMRGSIWTSAPGTARLVVLDPSVADEVEDWGKVDDVLGVRLFDLFSTISGYLEVGKSFVSLSGSLGVTRCISHGDAPADQVSLPDPPASMVRAFMAEDHPVLAKAESDYKAKLANPPPPVKTWDAMSPKEQQDVIRQVAEKMGLVAKA